MIDSPARPERAWYSCGASRAGAPTLATHFESAKMRSLGMNPANIGFGSGWLTASSKMKQPPMRKMREAMRISSQRMWRPWEAGPSHVR